MNAESNKPCPICGDGELLKLFKELIDDTQAYIEDACMKDDGNDGGVVHRVERARKLLAKIEEDRKAKREKESANPVTYGNTQFGFTGESRK